MTLSSSDIQARMVTVTLIREDLPLAVYREVAAHLEQIPGLTITLKPQTAEKFDYFQSQVGALVIAYYQDLAPGDRQQLEAIIDFYAQRYGPWQRQEE